MKNPQRPWLRVFHATNRGKLGSKQHIIADHRDLPFALYITGSNRHDSQTRATTIAVVAATSDSGVQTVGSPVLKLVLSR